MLNIVILLLISSNALCQKFNSTSTGMKDAKNTIQTVQFTKCQNEYLDESYINDRLISNDQFTAIASSERDNYPFSNAFDRKSNSYWVAKDLNTETFKNYIIISFKKTQKIEAILYVTPYSVQGNYRVYDGVPGILTIYASIGNEEFKPVCAFQGEATWPDDKYQFVFPKEVECDKLKLEFTEITICRSFGLNEYVPATGELSLIKKLPAEYLDIQNQINGLFTDYAQFNLIPSITAAKVNELRGKASKMPNYEKSLKLVLDRADAVLKGAIRKDPHREFSTKPGSKNKIEQVGNTLSYCRNVIKFQKFGCNSQVIGIGGYGDKPITVFVDAEPLSGVKKSEVKLPNIRFSQKDGTWEKSFHSQSLKLGRNDLIFYDFLKLHDSYKSVKNLISGGPIHIENPYTLEEQKGHVSLYIELGYTYPVFRSGDDEESFKVILKDYYNRLNDPTDDEIIISTFESLSKHLIASTTCELAYDAYINRGLSIQANLNKWDKYIRDLLEFSGLSYDPKSPVYDVRNEYIKENYRGVQEWAGSLAFAANDMIGLPFLSTQQHLVYLDNPGWAMAHETGHTLDKSGRVWSENTNNMWSMHDLFRMSNNVQDKLSISEVTEKLSSDFSEYVTHANGKIVHRTDPVVWWILEGAIPGYWGAAENMYVYEKSDLNDKGSSILKVCERNIYYSCLAAKKNLCAYFERFGFYFKGDASFGDASHLWTYSKSTADFKNLLTKAITEGRIVDECPKYWYVNLEHYRVVNKHNNKLGDWATCYSSNDEIKVVSIQKLGNFYSITLPEIKNKEAHLCYEVQSFINNKWQVVGSTYSQFFSDYYPYASGVTPKYRIIGYDRNFHTSKALDGDTNPEIENIEKVARIGEKYYSSLQAALDDVKTDNEIVYIMKSLSAISLVFNINKMKVEPDPSLTETLTISKVGTGDLIKNGGNCKELKFGSNNGVTIVFDGNNIRNKGNFINGGFQHSYFYNCIFRNNHNEENGGAIYVGHDCRTHLENSIIEGCSATYGGAVYTTGGYRGVYDGKIELINSIIRNCVASVNGGAIYGSAINGWNNIEIKQNSIIENNQAQNGGAISFICYCMIRNSIIRNNVAHVNGGAIHFNKEIERDCQAEFDHATFTNNVAKQTGYTIYINAPGVQFHLNGGKICGNIYKADGALIYLQKHQDPQSLPDFSEAKFYLNIQKDGVNLIDKINNYAVDSIINQIRIENGYAKKGSDGTVKAMPNRCTLKVNFNGQTINYEINHGVFTFPNTFDGLNKDYYITEWRSGGKTYKIGDKLNILTNMNFDISAKLYFKLTFKYGSRSEIIKVTQGSKYYLPAQTPDGLRVYGFDCSNGKYYAYAEPVTVTSDLSFTAVLFQAFTIIVYDNEIMTVYQRKFGEYFSLPESISYGGDKFFKYWIVNGEQYQPFDEIIITADTTINAYFSDKITVKLIYTDREEIKECRLNEKIDLIYTGPEKLNQDTQTGRDFDYWLIEGKKYLPYSKYIVTKNVDIFAHYAVIDKTKKIEVKFDVPVVTKAAAASSSARSIKSTVTKSFSYLDNLTFPDGETFGDFGLDTETSTDIRFIYWNFNGVRYNKDDVVGVTTAFNVVAVTGSEDDLIPSKSPTPRVTPTRVPASTKEPMVNVPGPEDNPIIDPDKDKGIEGKKKGGSNAGMIAGVVVAVIVVGAAAAVVTFFVLKKKKLQVTNEKSMDELSDNNDNSEFKDPEKPENQDNQSEKKPEQVNEQKTELVNEQKPEPVNEQKPEQVNEQKTEPINEQKPEPVNEQKPELVNEQKPEPVNEQKPEPVNEQKPEPVNEQKPEPVNEQKPEPVNEQKTEPINEQKHEPVNEQKPEPINEQKPEPVNEQKPEPVNEQKTEPINEQKTEPINEQKTEPVNEQKPEPVNEQKPEPVNEQKTEPVNEQKPEPVNKQPPEVQNNNAQELHQGEANV